jgi:tRNA threonylcarbamoyl adenosine modification protein YeaZ
VLLLAIDTATSAVTVALHDGERALAESTTLNVRGHGELLAPAIAEVLERSGRVTTEVTEVCCGVGPGPFTGLRVGIVTARVFGLARAIPVRGVCSLDALAHAASRSEEPPPSPFLVATDARRKEVYWAEYDVTPVGVERRDDPAVTRPGDLPQWVRERSCVGRGPVLYPEAFGAHLPPLDVSAAALAELAVQRMRSGGELLEPEPLYLRRPDAQPVSKTSAASS